MFSLLYIDDESGLLELGKLFLESTGEFEVTTALSADAGLAQLALQDFDAIVSDFQMPMMDGIELLKRVRKSFGSIPFVLFTGRGREEVVIEAINNGVDFYLQKGGDPKAQFAELAHKVRQAVIRRRAEIALSDSEQRLADIINFLPDATFAIDTRGVIIAWNRAMERMTGSSSAEVLGKGDYEYALPFYHERRPLLINLVLEDDPAIAGKYPVVKREGRTLFSEITIPHFNAGRGAALWFTASPLFNRMGEMVGAIESIREITERKRAEGALLSANREYTNLLDQIQDVYYRSDNEGRLVRASRSWATLFGYDDVSECIGKSIADDFYVNPPDRKQLLEEIRQNGKVTGFQILLRKKDGTPVLVEASSHLYFDPAGKIIGIEGTFRDITERKRAEEELRAANEQLVASEEELQAQYNELATSEERIRQSEQKYRTVFETTGTAMLMIEDDATISLVNAEFSRLSGYTREEIENKKRWTEFVVREDHDRMVAQHRMRRENRNNALQRYEFRFLTRSGEIHDIFLSIDVVPGTRKSVASLLDITEKKKADDELLAAYGHITANEEELREQLDELTLNQNALRKSEGRFRDLVEASPDIIWEMDTGGVFTYMSPLSVEMIGFTPEEIVGKTVFALVPKEALAPFEEIFSTSVRTKKPPKGFDLPLRCRDGHVIITEIRAVVLADSDGRFSGFRGIARDITDKKKAADELLAAYEQLTATDEELQQQYNELAESEKRIRLSETRLTYMLGFYEYAQKSEKELLAYAIEGAGIVTGSTLGYLAFLNEDESELSMYAWSKSAMTECSMREKPIVYKTEKTGLWGEAVRQRHAVITNDYAAPNLAKKGYPEGHPRIIRHMNVPVIEDGHIVLVAGVANKSSDYSEIDASELLLLMQGLWTILRQRRVQEELRMVKISVDLAADEVFWMDFEGNILYVNDAACRINGYSRDEFLRMNIIDLNHDLTPAIWSGSVTDLRQRKSQLITTRHTRKDGMIADVEIMAVYVRQDGKEYSFAFVRDITERKRAEIILADSERKYRTLFETANEGIWTVDAGFSTTSVNKKMQELFGFTEQEMMGRPIWDFVPSGDVESMKQLLFERRTGVPGHYERRWVRKDGTIIWCFTSATPLLSPDGTFIGSFGMFTDITERRRAEAALRESESKFRAVIDQSFQFIGLMTPDGILVESNRAALALIGIAESEVINRPFWETPWWSHSLELQEILKDAIRRAASGETVRFEASHPARDGHLVYVDFSVKPVVDKAGRIQFLIPEGRDITERKQAEAELRKNNNFTRALLDAIPTPVFYKDRDGRYIGCNRAFSEIMGVTSDQLAGKTVFELWPSDLSETYHQKDIELMEHPQHQIYEFSVRDREGTVRPVIYAKDAFFDGAGQVAGIVGAFLDISGIKQAEQALRESEEKYRTLVESSFDGIAIHQDGIIVYVNRTGARLLGSDDTAGFVGKPAIDIIAPAFRERIAQRIREATESMQELIHEQFLRLDGTPIDVDVTTMPSMWKGRPAAYVTFRDITSQLRAEEALRESEEKYRTLVEVNRDIIYSLSNDGTVLYVSPQTITLLGYRPDEMEGRNFSDFVHPDDVEKLVRYIREDSDAGKPVPSDRFRVRRNDGTYCWFEDKTIYATDPRGDIIVAGTIRDITDEKAVQDALRESEEKFRELVEATSDFIWEIDAEGKYTYVSPQVRYILGYEAGDLVGRTPFDIMPRDDAEKISAIFNQYVASRLPITGLENKAIRKDGSVVILETSGVVRTADDGSFLGYRGIDRDITVRKHKGEALRESEARLSSILHGSPVLQFVIDGDHQVISWNNALEEYSGIRAADIIGTDHQWRAFYPGKRPVLADLLIDGDTGAISRLYEGKFRKSRYVEGAYEATDFFPHMGSSGIWLSFTAAPIRDEGEKIIGAVETLEDVTERVNAENALRESEERTRTILNTAQAGIVLVDAVTHQIVDANKKALELIGLDRDSVVGTICHRFICPAERGKCPVTDLGQQVNTSERVLITAAGEKIPVLKTVVPVLISGRNVLVESFVDISEQKRSEAAIREANRKLNLLNSITRHDIRNQLMVAQGFAQLAVLSKPDATVLDFLARIAAAIEMIQRQIEFTKAYQELGVHAPSWFLLGEVISSVRPGKIALCNTCKPVEIFADPMIDKVFFNLFDNAVKYGERVTKVTVTCEEIDDYLAITFADNGCGIPPAEKKKIFEKGYGKNTGLGLFLVREILAITGITIHENGTSGEGAAFGIIIPKGMYRQPEQTRAPAYRHS